MVKTQQLTKNFNINEFACKDGTPVPDSLECNVIVLAQNLQNLRDDLNKNRPASVPKDVDISVQITSGYRTPAYNKKIGGVNNSQHPKGKAADLTCKWLTPKQLAARIEKLIAEGHMKQGGIGIYPGFCHYDCRGTYARW